MQLSENSPRATGFDRSGVFASGRMQYRRTGEVAGSTVLHPVKARWATRQEP